ncbi:MAG: hypothetical protein KC561_15135, partial [Myxococcales bacterium]|nr:hypothetical protein [Myxococcales bacterium]
MEPSVTEARVGEWLTRFVEGLETLADDDDRTPIEEALALATSDDGFLGGRWASLSHTERRFLLVSLAAELDLDASRLIAEATQSFSMSRPTVATCITLAGPDSTQRLLYRKLLMPGSRLVEDGWLRVEGIPGRRWLESEVRVSTAAVQLALGQEITGTDLDSLCRVWEPGPTLE